LAQYYFTVASLPQLFFDSEVYPAVDSFLLTCSDNLNRRDLNLVKIAAGLGTPAEPIEDEPEDDAIKNRFLERWQAWNLSLSADIAVLRAQALGQELEHYQATERVFGTETVAREACNQENPLLAEEVIERARWSFLEEMEVGHYFDTQKILIYLYRLVILTRKAGFTVEKGTESFHSIYSEISNGKIGEIPEKTQ
jgi:hypothetical protein